MPTVVRVMPRSWTMRASIGNAVMPQAAPTNRAACQAATPSANHSSPPARYQPSTPPATIGASTPAAEATADWRTCPARMEWSNFRPTTNM